ncbi:hypothetical protein DPV78_008169 [Talaromyces pinophilus]|nr:hypothetical protein DPV78_008169 [Talaromyces pinophilus]
MPHFNSIARESHGSLPYNSQSSLPSNQVPVLGSRNKRYTYDHQGFYTYPKRAGFDLSLLRRREIPHSKSSEDVASFLQAWLFFGFLGVQGELSKIDKLLLIASEFVREALFEDWQFGKLYPPDVTLSISILRETLSNAHNMAYFIAPGSKQESIWTPVALALGLQQPGEMEQLIRSLQLPGPIEGAFLMPWHEGACLLSRSSSRKAVFIKVKSSFCRAIGFRRLILRVVSHVSRKAATQDVRKSALRNSPQAIIIRSMLMLITVLIQIVH